MEWDVLWGVWTFSSIVPHIFFRFCSRGKSLYLINIQHPLYICLCSPPMPPPHALHIFDPMKQMNSRREMNLMRKSSYRDFFGCGWLCLHFSVASSVSRIDSGLYQLKDHILVTVGNFLKKREKRNILFIIKVCRISWSSTLPLNLLPLVMLVLAQRRIGPLTSSGYEVTAYFWYTVFIRV